MRHTLSVLVENKPGVLARIAGLFSRRAFNIQSLSVAETERAGYSRMTIVALGDRAAVEQIEKHLNKLINVIKVSNLMRSRAVERELGLVKVMADADSRPSILQIVEMFRARVVDVAPRSLVIEATGDQDKLDALLGILAPYGVSEVVRSGPLALARGQSRMGLGDGAIAPDLAESTTQRGGTPDVQRNQH